MYQYNRYLTYILHYFCISINLDVLRCELGEDFPAQLHTNIGSEEIIYRSPKMRNHAPNLTKILGITAMIEIEKNTIQENCRI